MNIVFHFVIEMVRRFPRHFVLLFIIILTQVFLTSLTVLTIAPIVDFLVANDQANQSGITTFVSSVIQSLGFSFQLWHALVFFGVVSLLAGIVSFIVQYATYRIKFDVQTDLLTSTLSSFFRAKLLFFTQ